MIAPHPGTRADSDGLAEALPCLCDNEEGHADYCPASNLTAVRAWHTAQVANLTARAETAEAKVAAATTALDSDPYEDNEMTLLRLRDALGATP